MRAGACTLQQTLTSEAASVLKHSLSLARRRGHGQVTPLHVAATLLTSKVSLLRRACLKSQPQQASHPLQCRALELCFNVALNRLPTIPGPLLHGQPSLSNALIAALRRAQAQQRRGCIEQQQQQPLLAIKVELEQLILSILDDPSVSRVMREAGFSSTAVKNNLEDFPVSSVFQCYNSSGGIYSTPSSPPSETTPGDFITPKSIWHSPFLSYSSVQNQIHFSPQKRLPNKIFTGSSTYLSEDIKLLEEMLLQKKRKNAVVVGDSLFITENLVAEFMAKVERGNVPEGLKSVHFIKFHFSAATLRIMKRDEVEANISDLKRKVENLVSVGKGVIIYIGNLKWTVETLSEGENECQLFSYSPVNHLVAEIGKLLSFYSTSEIRFWLLAIANYQTYIRCQMKQPALDIQWALQAVSVPSDGLGLSLNAASVHNTSVAMSEIKFPGEETKPLITGKEEQDFFNCCPECTSNYKKEIASKSLHHRSFLHSSNDKTSNELPHWLNLTGTNVAEKEYSCHLKRKWSKLCQCLHQRKHNGDHGNYVFGNLCHDSYQRWPSYKNTFLETKPLSIANTNMKPNQSPNSVPRFRRQQSCHIEFNFSSGNSKSNAQTEPNLDGGEDKEAKITLALGSSLLSDGIQGSDIYKLLKENVPWQSKDIPRVLEAIMDSDTREKDIWLLFQGNDSIGKQKLALGIAKAIAGSTDLLFYINVRKNGQHREMLENALRNHDRLVVLLENIEFADTEFLKFLADGCRSGRIGTLNKNEENPCQAIFILTKLDSTTYSDGKGKRDSVIEMKLIVDETNNRSGMFSSDHKRKAGWDFEGKSKSTRQGNMEHIFEVAVENGKKLLTRQLSSNILDLNVEAEDEENERVMSKDLSPISNDLATNYQENPLIFLDLIKNRFVLDRDSADDNYIREIILSKIKGSFEKVFGSKDHSCFAVEGNILEEIFLGSGTFLDTLFENWLKDIFETSLTKIGRIDGSNIMLCLGEESGTQEGFMGTCLPKNVEVSFLN